MRNCIGIDISKGTFDVFILEKDKAFLMNNDFEGVNQCVKLCHQIQPELIVPMGLAGRLRLQTDR